MKILGIETVTRVGSLAVVFGEKVLGCAEIDISLRHAAMLIPTLSKLLQSIEVDISEIGGIAVDTGPGSFTGIRVAIASALGLSHPYNINLRGVCSLDVLAHQVSSIKKGDILMPVIDAKRGAVYSAIYEIRKGEVCTIKEPFSIAIKDFIKEIPMDARIYGPDMDKLAPLFQHAKTGNIDIKNEFPSAVTAAMLAVSSAAADKFQVSNVLEPRYIHDVEYKTV